MWLWKSSRKTAIWWSTPEYGLRSGTSLPGREAGVFFDMGRRLPKGYSRPMDGTFERMAQALKAGGLLAALSVLNARIAHRYSAVYRLEGTEQLLNLALVDKQGESCPAYLHTVPYDRSFCQFAVREGQFRTDNSALDERLTGHPYQGVMNSYHSVPLVSTEGRILGTVCHFDPQALTLDEEDFELLRLAARVFATYLPPTAKEMSAAS